LFGCTGWARKFRLRVLDEQGKLIQNCLAAEQIFIWNSLNCAEWMIKKNGCYTKLLRLLLGTVHWAVRQRLSRKKISEKVRIWGLSV